MTAELARRLDEMKAQTHEALDVFLEDDGSNLVEFIQTAGARCLHTGVDVVREEYGTDDPHNLAIRVGEFFPGDPDHTDWVDNTDWETDKSVLGTSLRLTLERAESASTWNEDMTHLFYSAFVNGFTTAANEVAQVCADMVAPRVEDGQHRIGQR